MTEMIVHIQDPEMCYPGDSYVAYFDNFNSFSSSRLWLVKPFLLLLKELGPDDVIVSLK